MTQNEQARILSALSAPTLIGEYLRAAEASALMRDVPVEMIADVDEDEQGERWEFE